MPIIRHATPGDLPALVSLESACFPPAEAATREALSARLAAYPNHFSCSRMLSAGKEPRSPAL